MKNNNYIISGILVVAVVVLFILQFTEKKHENKEKSVFSDSDSVSAHLPIAYVDSDSLLVNFNFYTQLINEYENKLSRQNGQLQQRYQNFQKEVAEFQGKVQNNAFLTRERAEQENSRLARKQKEIEQAAAQVEQELSLQQRIIQQQLSDTILSAMKEFNNPPKYQLVLTKAGILYASETYDITKEFIEFLNNRYVDKEKE